MNEQILDIIIDWDTLQITAHIEGESDAMKCKEEILEFLEELGHFTEGRFTIEFKVGDDDGGTLVQNQMGSSSTTKKERN